MKRATIQVNAKPADAAAPAPALIPRQGAPRQSIAAVAAPAIAGPTDVPTPPAIANPVSHFIDLEIEARQCPNLDALRYAMVNSTRQLAAFDQAFLLEPSMQGHWQVSRASSVTKIDRNAALIRAIDAWARHASAGHGGGDEEPRLVNLEHDRAALQLPAADFAFPHGLWLPVKSRNGRMLAVLLLLKSENWRPQFSVMMLPLAGAYGHAWAALEPAGSAPMAQVRGMLSKARLGLAACAVLAVAAFIPVPMSALAPAEIVAREPILVTAPIDGIVGDILVPAGSWVEQGTPIVKLVDVKLRNDAAIAGQSRAVAEARYFKIVQAATATQKDMQDLATAKAELDLANAEFTYANDLLARAQIRAERSGLLIYSAKSDWLGKPVAVGEKLMEIGDPKHTEIRLQLPVSDAIALEPGGAVSLFLDGDPLRAVAGSIVQASYRPSQTADQQLAFRVQARFNDGVARRIGLRGVARIDGQRVALWFYLFRRPIAALRQRFGL